MSFDGLVIRNKFLLESSHCIDTRLNLVVEFIEVHSSVDFEFCIDKEFI